MIRTWHILLIFFTPLVQAETFSLVVQGLGGTVEFEQSFSGDAKTVASTIRGSSDNPENHVLLTGEEARRDSFNDHMDHLAKRMGQNDRFVLTLVGHGTYDGSAFKFNVPGPDISGQDLVLALSNLPSKHLLLVIASSSSGALVDLLSAQGRTLITATKSGRERQAVLFPGYWAEAMTSESADTNKDDLLSATEAFQYTEKKVQEYYKSNDLLASEHPQMNSNTGQEFYLARTGKLLGTERNPRISLLLEQRSLIADEFYALKDQKTEFSEAAYLDALENVLLRMARLQMSIDAELDTTKNANDDS